MCEHPRNAFPVSSIFFKDVRRASHLSSWSPFPKECKSYALSLHLSDRDPIATPVAQNPIYPIMRFSTPLHTSTPSSHGLERRDGAESLRSDLIGRWLTVRKDRGATAGPCSTAYWTFYKIVWEGMIPENNKWGKFLWNYDTKGEGTDIAPYRLATLLDSRIFQRWFAWRLLSGLRPGIQCRKFAKNFLAPRFYS
jgi:hypothetical protein